MESNIIKVNFKRQRTRTFTCHLYTNEREKYRLVINAKNTTQAYHIVITESVKYGVSNVICIVFFTQSPESIDNDTIPLKVHLTPEQAEWAIQ